MANDDIFISFNADGAEIIQGHTAKIKQDGSFWKLKCQTCGWESTACSFEEARFDFRYHGLKTREDHHRIDWDKLL